MKGSIWIVVSWVCLMVFFSQCGPSSKEVDIYEDMDFRTRIRMRQYMTEGKGLYQIHCANCHGEDGKGLGKLIPPLAKADFLQNNIEAAICISRNGMQGSIVVNGVEYNQQMPGHDDLTDLEIAEIVTFVGNAWGNKSGLIDVKTTSKILEGCE